MGGCWEESEWIGLDKSPQFTTLSPITFFYDFLSSVQFSCSVMSDFLRPPWSAARQASLSITNSQSLLKLMCIESVMPFNHLILCHLLLLWPSVFPSIRVFSSELVLHIRWPKYQSFSFSTSPSKEYSIRIAWLDINPHILATYLSLISLWTPGHTIVIKTAFFFFFSFLNLSFIGLIHRPLSHWTYQGRGKMFYFGSGSY